MRKVDFCKVAHWEIGTGSAAPTVALHAVMRVLYFLGVGPPGGSGARNSPTALWVLWALLNYGPKEEAGNVQAQAREGSHGETREKS
jgi:hypothetical protein